MQKRKSFDFPPKILYENRYCNQNDFSVLVCGGRDKNYKTVESIFKISFPKFECEEFILMPNPRKFCKTVVINSDLFVLGGKCENSKNNDTLIRYCNKTKTWSSTYIAITSKRKLFLFLFLQEKLTYSL